MKKTQVTHDAAGRTYLASITFQCISNHWVRAEDMFSYDLEKVTCPRCWEIVHKEVEGLESE